MSKTASILGNIFFWLVVLGASAGAFAVGFYYTFGMTVDVHTKSPVAASTPKPGAIHNLPSPKAKASPSLAPGPLPVSSVAAVPTKGPNSTPTPMAQLGMADPSPMATETPRARPTRAAATPAAPKEEIYRVQVGAFDSRESAQKQVDELQTVGINAVVVYDAGAYHAQLGAFGDRARAIAVADDVNTRGYSVTIRH